MKLSKKASLLGMSYCKTCDKYVTLSKSHENMRHFLCSNETPSELHYVYCEKCKNFTPLAFKCHNICLANHEKS